MQDVIPGSCCLLDLHSIRWLDWIHLPFAPRKTSAQAICRGDRLGSLTETRCDEQSKYALAQWFLCHPWLNIMRCIYFYPSPPLWINVFNLPVTKLSRIFMWGGTQFINSISKVCFLLNISSWPQYEELFLLNLNTIFCNEMICH